VEVTPGRNHLLATIRFPKVKALLNIVARLRRLFDLDADVASIGAHLSGDADLAPLISKRPGLRTPGSWDGFELACRAIFGQQITVGGARKLAGHLVARAGIQVSAEVTGETRLDRIFPNPERVASADLSSMPMPKARVAALKALADAAAKDAKLLDPTGSFDDTIERLLALPGFGPWTAQYWALRALRDSDAFPAADVGLLRHPAFAVNGDRPTPKALLERAEAWRPWRAYAAQHLWTSDAEAANG
jgi:AraC family transcriptional regulator of adaptative response / DNA-3-methyladenine glycosylase II